MADWKDIVRTVAPALASAFGTPLAGSAVKVLGDVILGDGKASEADLQKAIENNALTPDILLKLKEQDQQYLIQIKQIALQNRQADIQETQNYLVDTQNARQNFANNNHEIDYIGIGILATFAIVLFASLWGSYLLLTGGIVLKEAATVGMVTGFIGALVGYAAANAQQVVSFRYGSSRGSEKKTDGLVDAFKVLKY